MMDEEVDEEPVDGSEALSFEPDLDQDPKHRDVIGRARARGKQEALRKTGDNDVSEDIAQQVALAFLRKVSKTPGLLADEFRAMAWVVGTTKNKVYKFFESEQRRRETDAIGQSEYIDHPRLGADTEADAAYSILARLLDEIVDAMPTTRRLVMLHQLHTKATYAETAAALDISVKTVEAHVAAGFGEIRRKLAEYALGSSRDGERSKRARPKHRHTKAERHALLESARRGSRRSEEEGQLQ